MQKIYFFSFIILLSSCSPRIDYLGSTNQPTSRVDVFVDEATIKKNYDIVGKGYVHYSVFNKKTIEKIQNRAIEKAKKKGADAVLIQDYYVANTNTSISTTTRKDSVYRGMITAGNTNISSTGTTGYSIYFLKYSQK